MNIGDRWRVTVALWLIVLPCVGFADELSDLQRKAENGEVAAQGILGLMYDDGLSVPQDDKQAEKFGSAKITVIAQVLHPCAELTKDTLLIS